MSDSFVSLSLSLGGMPGARCNGQIKTMSMPLRNPMKTEKGLCHPNLPNPTRERVFLAALAVALVYANIAVIFNWPLEQLRMPRFPLSESTRDAFLVFGVFSYYETNNQELTIWGLATNPRTSEAYWKQLPNQNYFPFSRGEQGSRMWATRQYNNPDRKGHWEAWQFMGRRIKERHNKLYPNDPITKVAFQSMTWPRSPDGFYRRQSAQDASKDVWTIAE